MSECVEFSALESAMLGFKFGRYNVNSIDPTILRQETIAGKFDVVRIRTNASDELASIKLQKTGFPFYFNGGVRRYKVNCMEAPLPPFTHPDICFELFVGQKKETLRTIIKESWGDYPLCYYRTPGLEEYITKEMEADCLFSYYEHFNNNVLFENNYLWFMKLGEKYVGFIALYLYREKNMVDSTIAGFLKAYQGIGLFPNILRHIRLFCRNQQITYFCCGARNENIYSQKAFEKDYMLCEGVEYIYHLLPMLSHNQLMNK